jgi:hypothetical protein
MKDVADRLLPDVREISITELEFADEGSALDLALKRILKSDATRGFNSFSSVI